MAAFYGTVEGNRGTASRTGSKDSGISTTAQSYDGSVNVWLREWNGKLMVDIRIAEGSSAGGALCFNGTLEALKAKLEG